MKMKIDVETAKRVLSYAVGTSINFEDMTISASQSNRDVKIYNDNVLFNVSTLTAKQAIDDCARWVYSVLCLDSASGCTSLLYVHPITNMVYDDPRYLDYATLPLAS